MKLTPVFIFSLPRSGSTLLQKILAVQPGFSTISEPWILLPLLNSKKEEGGLAKYGHRLCAEALNDLIGKMGWEEAYYERLRAFILSIYRSVSSESSRFFVDKTPRYYLIIAEIAQLFPNAKFIFLFRDPVEIFSSVITTCRDNSFVLHGSYVDLYDAPGLLARGYEELKNKSVKVRYEDLVSFPEREGKRLFEYLGVEGDVSLLEGSAELELNGRMGDKPRGAKNTEICTDSIRKWEKVIDTPFRKWTVLRYVKGLPEEFFKCSGYDRQSILKDVGSLKTKFRWSMVYEVAKYCFSVVYRFLNLNMFVGEQRWAVKDFMS